MEVRDLMEKLVESLVEEHLDETPITPLSSHPSCEYNYSSPPLQTPQLPCPS
jgi:hypothetical protein